MKLSSEIILNNLSLLEDAIKSFDKLSIYRDLIKQKDLIINNGGRYTPEYFKIDRDISDIESICKLYKIDIYLNFINFIYKTELSGQEVFYKSRIKNSDFQRVLSDNAIDADVKKSLSKKTKSTFFTFINSNKWDVYRGYRSKKSRISSFSYNDNISDSDAIIANYCIQNEIEIKDTTRIKNFYTKLIPELTQSILNEINRTGSIIDFMIGKISEDNYDFRKINLDHLISSIKNELRSKISSFDKNEKIRCIEAPIGTESRLTINKSYEVLDTRIESGFLNVVILDDSEIKTYCPYRYFETISNIRDSLINDFLSDDE